MQKDRTPRCFLKVGGQSCGKNPGGDTTAEGGKMKKEKVKLLPVIKDFVTYIVPRAKRVLRLKSADFDHMSIDVHPRDGTIWVWVHGKDEIIGRAQFRFDGQCYSKVDNRNDEEAVVE